MIPLEVAQRIELDRMLSDMPPESVAFLRLITEHIVRALSKEEPILVMFPEMQKEEIEIYTRGMDNADVYTALVEAAQIMLESQATAPAPTTTQ